MLNCEHLRTIKTSITCSLIRLDLTLARLKQQIDYRGAILDYEHLDWELTRKIGVDYVKLDSEVLMGTR